FNSGSNVITTTSMSVSKETITTSITPNILLEGSSSSKKIDESYVVLQGNNSTDIIPEERLDGISGGTLNH
ncbi:3980_t:CDS:2, partial [Racocetra persica]